MKKIAITQRLIDNNNYPEIREALDINHAKLLNELEFLPIVLPYEVEFEKYFRQMHIKGVLLTGGNDLNSLNPNIHSKKRDIFEKNLLEYCIINSIPVFGICRGMQLIGEYFDMPIIETKNQINVRHQLTINNKSKYFNYLTSIREVNSYHNYALKDTSKEFIISAKSGDGIIKAIEHKKKKIFAQMWHSERENPFNKNELELIKAFFNKT